MTITNLNVFRNGTSHCRWEDLYLESVLEQSYAWTMAGTYMNTTPVSTMNVSFSSENLASQSQDFLPCFTLLLKVILAEGDCLHHH